MRGTLPRGVPFWLIWLLTMWQLPLAGLVNWLGRDGRRRPAGLSDAPVEYLRMEYRGSRSGWRRADQDVAVRTGESSLRSAGTTGQVPCSIRRVG